MDYTRIHETTISESLRASELLGVVPLNTRKEGALLRRLLRLLIDHKCISMVSLLVTFGLHSCSLGKTSATGLCFILVAHEAGHLVAGSYLKISLPWPVFIPKVGALILLKEETRTSYDSAWLGVSGPIAGLLATGAIHFLSIYTDLSELRSCAKAGYAMHLFNLIPFGDLDGGRIALFIGKWLWILGAGLQLTLLFYFRNLPWYTALLFVWILWSGCLKIWRSILGCSCAVDVPRGLGPNARVGMATLYGLLILVCICGLNAR